MRQLIITQSQLFQENKTAEYFSGQCFKRVILHNNDRQIIRPDKQIHWQVLQTT